MCVIGETSWPVPTIYKLWISCVLVGAGGVFQIRNVLGGCA